MKKSLWIIFIIVVIALITAGLIYAHIIAQDNYNHKKEEPLLNDINLEEITDENGLIFKITRNDAYSDCNFVFLKVYNDGIYQLTTTQLTQNSKIIHPILEYGKPTTGTYTYDIKEIFLNLKKANKKYYIITTGTGETYTTDQENEKLNEFLEEIDVNLDACLQKKAKDE